MGYGTTWENRWLLLFDNLSALRIFLVCLIEDIMENISKYLKQAEAELSQGQDKLNSKWLNSVELV